jgi:hypothetical protein
VGSNALAIHLRSCLRLQQARHTGYGKIPQRSHPIRNYSGDEKKQGLENATARAIGRQNFRILRKVHLIMFFSVFPTLGLPKRPPGHIHHTTIIVAAIVLRTTLIQLALDVLQTKADDKISLVRWRAGRIISYSLAEVVVLIGFEMRALGATLARTAPFYIAAIVLMLFLRAQRP